MPNVKVVLLNKEERNFPDAIFDCKYGKGIFRILREDVKAPTIGPSYEVIAMFPIVNVLEISHID